MSDPTPPGRPDWHMPQPGEVYPADAGQRVDQATLAMRTAIVGGTAAGLAGRYGLSFDLTNPLLRNAIQQLGQKITAVVESQRDEIMRSLQEAYDTGLSIDNAARKMVADSTVTTEWRARMIARTELTSGTSLGSLAAARLVDSNSPGSSMLKGWLSAQDSLVRDDHIDADDEYSGTGIPLDQPFIVGGEEMQHPGDPDGPPEQVVNCRCTLIYLQGEGATNTLGPVTAAAAPEAHDLSEQADSLRQQIEEQYRGPLEEAYSGILDSLARDAARNFRALQSGSLTASGGRRRSGALLVRRVVRR